MNNATIKDLQNPPKLILTNYQVDAAIDNIAMAITMDEWQPDLIIAIHAGGLIPAAHLWYKLCKHKSQLTKGYSFGSIYAKSYNGAKQEDIVIDIPKHVEYAMTAADNILLMDDIYDTGHTFEAVMKAMGLKNVKKTRTAAITTKKPVASVNYKGRIDTPETWIVFPWEVGVDDPFERSH